MAPRQRVRVTGGAAGDPAVASDVPSVVVGAARRREQRLQAFGRPEPLNPARRASPVAEAGAR